MFIRTVYAFGYEFIAEVSELASRSEPARARFWLICEHRQTPLLEGPNVIGRAPDATIQLDFPGVSRYHARIALARGEAVIEDLGSKNGTLVNGEPIPRARRLADGDEIRVGGTALIFRIGSATSPTATIVDCRGAGVR
jgi:pSer/pThr/pTyr-binding forkhead associated (FHA) protein